MNKKNKKTIKEEFLELLVKWNNYVRKDHHKDSDCHFSILKVEKTFSYGEDSTGSDVYIWYAFHQGYLLDDISEFFETEEECYDHFIKKMEYHMFSSTEEDLFS